LTPEQLLLVRGPKGERGAQGPKGDPGTFDSSELNNYASKEYVAEKIQEVVSAAPSALDTLEQIAAELESEESSTAAILAAIAELRERVSNLEPSHYTYEVSDYNGFCKLKLDDDSVINISGSGVLTPEMISTYKTNIVEVELGALCTAVHNETFKDCASLKSVLFSNSVKSLGNSSFKNCTGLQSVGLSNSISTIGNNAFENCSNLAAIDLGRGLTSIGDYAFKNCRNLQSIVVPNSTINLGQCAFYECNNLLTASLGKNVSQIKAYTFYNCYSLSSVTFGNKITSIST